MFLKKIGKKIIFAIRRKKAFFLDVYSQAVLNDKLVRAGNDWRC